MSSRLLFWLTLFILAFSGWALSAGVKVYESRINEDEFQYASGSARRNLLRARPARVIVVPE